MSFLFPRFALFLFKLLSTAPFLELGFAHALELLWLLACLASSEFGASGFTLSRRVWHLPRPLAGSAKSQGFFLSRLMLILPRFSVS